MIINRPIKNPKSETLRNHLHGLERRRECVREMFGLQQVLEILSIDSNVSGVSEEWRDR